MLAQAVTGTPGHVNSMARSVIHFIREFPVETMKPGDAYITNDPWMGTGHLNDFVITTPCFRNGKLVALFSCTSHLMDIGGIGFCFGGAIVLELARSGADVAGVVSFHGNLETTLPAKEGEVSASLLVLNGAADTYVPQAQITGFQDEMTAAGADWQFVNFSGAVHCFAEADANSPGCMYDPRAAKRAYGMMEDFFDELF